LAQASSSLHFFAFLPRCLCALLVAAGMGKHKRRPKKKEADVEAGDKRKWKDGHEGHLTRNVRYTAVENERLLQAVQDYCVKKNKTVEELGVRDERQNTGFWSRIAAMSGIKTRSVQSMSQRLRRFLFEKQRGTWSESQSELLADEVLRGDPSRPSWKTIGAKIGKSPQSCHDKWKSMFGCEKRGSWSGAEVWVLRQAVCEATNEFVPVANIPWRKVRQMVPHRSKEQCRMKWFHCMLPAMLQYQSKHGMPVETDVFLRLIINKLSKSEVEDFEMVNWMMVNKFWPAGLNKSEFAALQKTVPGSFEEKDFQETVRWLYEAKNVEGHRHRDKRVLKHAKSVWDSDFVFEDDGCSENAGEGLQPEIAKRGQRNKQELDQEDIDDLDHDQRFERRKRAKRKNGTVGKEVEDPEFDMQLDHRKNKRRKKDADQDEVQDPEGNKWSKHRKKERGQKIKVVDAETDDQQVGEKSGNRKREQEWKKDKDQEDRNHQESEMLLDGRKKERRRTASVEHAESDEQLDAERWDSRKKERRRTADGEQDEALPEEDVAAKNDEDCDREHWVNALAGDLDDESEGPDLSEDAYSDGERAPSSD